MSPWKGIAFYGWQANIVERNKRTAADIMQRRGDMHDLSAGHVTAASPDCRSNWTTVYPGLLTVHIYT
jgi:hypothetical protein